MFDHLGFANCKGCNEDPANDFHPDRYALQSRNGSEAGLIGLLSLYKQYFPQDVAAALPKNPSALLKVTVNYHSYDKRT